MPDRRPGGRYLLDMPTISLMWPGGRSGQTGQRGGTPGLSTWARDLHLDSLVRAFQVEARYVPFITQTLAVLNADPAVIVWRQAVLNDFLHNPALVEQVAALLPRLAELRPEYATFGKRQRNVSVLFETAERLAQLDLYQQVVQDLYEALRSAGLQADALRQLRQNLAALIESESFQTLHTKLPEWQRPLQRFASLTIGINLDTQLQPVAAVLLSINERRFGEVQSFLDKLLGPRDSDTDETMLASLHFTPPDPDQRPLSPLFRDLERLIAQAVQPVARTLNRHVRVSSASLTGLEHELAFYTMAVGFIRRLEARGLTFCQPEIAPADARIGQIAGLINIDLALREPDQSLVANDVDCGSEGRIAVLTGPNSGGKTTYVQAVGLAYVLFQAGLFIPAKQARISPADAIFTHFPVLETYQGRLSEEIARLRHICLNATRYSLVLLNESLSSTTASEGLYLAQEFLCGFRAIGVRAIYATHLVELAEHLNDIEATVEGESALYSLIAAVEVVDDTEIHAVPTFQIIRGQPQGRGYAREIARRYGVSLDQILQARRNNTHVE